MKNILTLFFLFILFTSRVQSQNDLSVSLGMGLPELFNAGIRYEFSPVKLGVSLGTAFTGAIALSGDVYYHFGGNSQLSNLPPWYLRANLTYWQLDKIWFIDLGKAVMTGFRIGRDISITEDLGISIDGGLIPFTFFSGKIIPFSIIPSVGISIYNRFGKMNKNRHLRN